MNRKRQNAVRPTWTIVHAVARHYFILKPHPEVLQRIFWFFAFKNKYIFHYHLICDRVVSELKPLSLLCFTLDQLLWLRIQKVKNFLVVELHILARYSNFVVRVLLTFNFHDFEKVPYCLGNYAVISFTNDWLETLASCLLVPVAFHCVGLTAACLTVDKNSGMKAPHNLFDQVIYPRPFVND